MKTQIKKLYNLMLQNQIMRGAYNPEVAARFQMDLFLNTIKGQEQYAEQLIQDEIEDVIKAGNALA
jgi:hypothetical protein